MLIAGLGYPCHYFVFQYHMGPAAQIRYQIYLAMIWISYFLAITKLPGSPPRNYKVPKHHWKKWCKKCENYKPERAHHCRKCDTCVLQMDHHCPWTNNCVGHENMPHFIRFLCWVIFTTGLTLWELSKRVFDYYTNSNLPAYLIPRSEMATVIVCWPIDAFVFFAVLLLFIKCMMHISTGKTQIEVWDIERIESQFHTERLWLKIRNNYRLVHGKEMPKLTLWNLTSRQYEELIELDELEEQEREELRREEQNLRIYKSEEIGPLNTPIGSELSEYSEIVPLTFTPDDLVFPYDMGIWENITNTLGSPWLWILPWGSAKGNGYEFSTNDDDDQLGLPWPPDGGNVDFEPRQLSDEELRSLGNISLVRKHLDPRSQLKRDEWINDMGETLNDYGVDVEAEEDNGLERGE